MTGWKPSILTMKDGHRKEGQSKLGLNYASNLSHLILALCLSRFKNKYDGDSGVEDLRIFADLHYDSMPSQAAFTGVQVQNKEGIVSWVFQMHRLREV